MALMVGCANDGAESTATLTATAPAEEAVASPVPSAPPTGSTPSPPANAAEGAANSPTPLPAIATPVSLPRNIDLESLTVPICRTYDISSNGTGIGTVPHATPTVIPNPATYPESSGPEVQSFVASLGSLLDATSAMTTSADKAWGDATDADSFARIIAFEGKRLSNLCSALSVIPFTSDGVDLVNMISKVLNDRRDVLRMVVQSLMDQPATGPDLGDSRRQSSAAIIGLKTQLDDYSEGVGITHPSLESATILNPSIGVTVNAPVGWVVVRNRLDIVLLAPPDRQIYSLSGLGPSTWNLGTALRIRRFRSNPPWELADAAATLDALYVQFGQRVDET